MVAVVDVQSWGWSDGFGVIYDDDGAIWSVTFDLHFIISYVKDSHLADVWVIAVRSNVTASNLGNNVLAILDVVANNVAFNVDRCFVSLFDDDKRHVNSFKKILFQNIIIKFCKLLSSEH